MRCIYCLEEKDSSQFTGREHVMLRAFGLFDTNNFVLKCVCDPCNKHFGDGIDMKIARDSVETIARVQDGLKDPSKYQSLGKRSTSRVEFMEGPMAGGWGYNVPGPQGEVIGMMAFPQVWFGRSEAGPFDKFRVELDEVPTRDELVAMGYRVGEALHVKSFEVTDLTGLLASKGITLDGVEMSAVPMPAPSDRLYAETVTRISHPEFRVATKIGLNYFATVVGSREAMLPELDAARAYARYGEERARVRAYANENSWFPGRRGHYISLTRVEDLIVAQISLLLRVQYLVVLAENAAGIPFKSSAHFFDLTTRKIVEIEPLRIVQGRALKAIE